METSMTHLDAGTIQTLLHGELPAGARAALEAHGVECPTCRAEIESARREDAWVRGRMTLLDAGAPDARIDSILAQSRARPGRSWRRAAAIVLLVGLGGVGVAGAIPAIRARVASMLSDGTPGAGGPSTAGRSTTPAAARGLMVAPGDSFVVTFESRQDRGVILVTLVTAGELAVRTTDSSVSFVSHDNGVTVRNEGASGDHEVDVPAAARYVEVRVGNRVVLRKQAAGIESSSARDAAGRYVIDLGTVGR
jgi:hypothetical protein